MENQKVEIIIPIYYKPELYLIIKKCLDSLDRYYPEIKKIIIDDTGGFCPFESTIKNQNNLGYVKSVNLGLKYSSAPVIIVANDDLEFKEGDLDRYFALKDEGIYFPRDSASGNLNRFGAIFGMTKKTLKKLGYLNEKYQNYFADIDYLNRAKKQGIPIVKWNDICVCHHESSTFNLIGKKKLFNQDKKIFSVLNSEEK